MSAQVTVFKSLLSLLTDVSLMILIPITEYGQSQSSTAQALTLAEVHFLYWKIREKQIN